MAFAHIISSFPIEQRILFCLLFDKAHIGIQRHIFEDFLFCIRICQDCCNDRHGVKMHEQGKKEEAVPCRIVCGLGGEKCELAFG